MVALLITTIIALIFTTSLNYYGYYYYYSPKCLVRQILAGNGAEEGLWVVLALGYQGASLVGSIWPGFEP